MPERKPVTFILLLTTWLLWGCSTTPYPPDWAPVDTRPATDCAPIAGTFSQRGETQGRKGAFWDRKTAASASRLSSLLGLSREAVGTTRVTVNLSAAVPRLTFWVGSEQLLSRNLTPDELRCEAGVWRLDLDWLPWRSSGILLDIGGTFVSLRLRQAVDGSLIVEKTEKMVGTAILLPVYASEQDWHRFPPESEVEKNPGPNAPHGVLARESGHARLLPPSTQKDWRDNPKSQDRCLKSAIEQFKRQVGDLAPADRARFGGRSTQAFLAQWSKGAAPYARTEWLDRTRGHTPTTYGALLRKPHWLDPAVSDRYVLCLLDAGYVWDDVAGNMEVR
jgi:hypothetical protein